MLTRNINTLGGTIKPVGSSRFWHRRISEIGFLLSIAIIVFVGWVYYARPTLFEEYQIACIAVASVAVIAVIGCLIYYISTFKNLAKKATGPLNRKSNTELNEVTDKSEVVIDAIGDGVIAIDNQGQIKLINPAAQNLIGWSKQDAMSLDYKSVLQLTDKKDEVLGDTSDPIQQVLNTNQQVRTNDLTATTSSGKKLMVSLVVSPVGDAGSGVIVVFRDITKEKTDEREQAEFISTASHEMRTPVASIEGYVGLALNPQTATLDDRARDFIQKAHESAQHLGRLFQDLLDVSKSEDGRMANNPKVINIVTFVHDIIDGLESKATEKGLQINFIPIPDDKNERIVAPVYSVNLDNDHVREIVSNLVENAIKYTLKGEISIDVTGDDEHVTVSVKDNGIGIPAEDMSHLFQKFYRVDNKDTREIGGTGLGLYLSRRLAEMMGGRIWVESTYGKGSAFYLELPRISNSEAERLKQQQDEIAAAPIDQSKTAIQTPAPTQMTVHVIPTTPQTPTASTTVPTQPAGRVMQPVNSVPRGQALTPEQIAEYVAKQRLLAQQQAKPQLSRPQPTVTPQRVPNQ